MNEYKGIKPRFGNKRKLYRLGGSPIDGTGIYEGYFYPTVNYKTGSITSTPYDPEHPYPYDDITYFIEEANMLDADMIVGINVGSHAYKWSGGLPRFFDVECS